MAEIVQARVWQKVDTLANWNNNNLILGKGEMALVVGNGGIPLNMRWGDGTKAFRDLPNAIAYDQGQFVAVVGNTLPSVTGVGYTILGGGTYTQSVGGNVVVPDGKLGVLVSEGGTWSLQSSVDLPTVEGVDVINPNGSGIPTEKAVADYAIIKKSKRILPLGKEFIEIDRPDLNLTESFINIDKELVINSELKPLYSMVDYFDRPDLFGHLLVDGDNNIISEELISLTNSSDKNNDDIIYFSEFKHQTEPINAFPYDKDYLQEISLWDELMNKYPEYIKKESIGKSSTGDFNIYKYTFTPSDYKTKTLVVGGTHGMEKNVIVACRLWFEYFVSNWFDSSEMQRARFDTQFTVVPMISPTSFNANPYAELGSIYKNGDRKVFETPPIKCNWERNSTTVTITIDEFPSGTIFNENTYFSHEGLSGKLWVGFISSSDDTVLKTGEGAVITVVSGNQITVNVNNSGSIAGTCEIIVPVDPNRNTPTETYIWEGFTPSVTNVNGYPRVAHDNKGTRPFSLRENISLDNLLNIKFDSAIFLHSGAANYYVSPPYGLDAGDFLDYLFSRLYTFSSERVTPVANRLTNGSYAYSKNETPAFTLEWLGQAAPVTAKDATDMIRFLFNTLLFTSKYYK